MKNKIKKHIRKYMTIFCSLLIIPLFSFHSYALEATYPQYNLDVPRLYSTTISSNFVLGDNYVYSYEGSHTLTDGLVIRMWSDDSETDNTLAFPVMPDLYDYYIYASFGQRSTGGTFAPNSIVLCNGRGTSTYPTYLSDTYFYKTQFLGADAYYNMIKYNFIAKLNVTEDKNNYYFGGIKFEGAGTISSVSYFEFTVFLVPKGDTVAVDNIVSAINNQTAELGGKLDGIDDGIQHGNDLIENGTDKTQSAVTDFNEVFEDFNNELDKVEEFDAEILDEFNAANEEYLTQLNNFELSASLLNAGNWLSTSMQTIYDNSSDYKMLWLVPLLFGIPILLFVVKKSGGDDE